MSKHFNDILEELTGTNFIVVPYSTTHWLHFTGSGTVTIQILIGHNARNKVALGELPDTVWADIEDGVVTLPDNVGRRVCALISGIKVVGTGTYTIGISSGDA